MGIGVQAVKLYAELLEHGFNRFPVLNPVTMEDGREYFIMIADPEIVAGLKLTPKEQWRWESRKKRLEARRLRKRLEKARMRLTNQDGE